MSSVPFVELACFCTLRLLSIRKTGFGYERNRRKSIEVFQDAVTTILNIDSSFDKLENVKNCVSKQKAKKWVKKGGCTYTICIIQARHRRGQHTHTNMFFVLFVGEFKKCLMHLKSGVAPRKNILFIMEIVPHQNSSRITSGWSLLLLYVRDHVVPASSSRFFFSRTCSI